jgi:hypothetical protein
MTNSLPNYRILNKDFEQLAEITNVTNVIWETAYSTVGTFQIQMPFDSGLIDILQKDYFIIDVDHPQRVGLLKNIQFQTSTDNETVIISGKTSLELLERRRTLPTSGLDYDVQTSVAVETAIKNWIKNNITNAVDTDRNISFLEVATDQLRGDTITVQTRYKSLLSECSDLATAYDLGHNIYYDEDTATLIYDVFEGIDRSSSQSVNDRVTFATDFGNILNEDYLLDTSNYRNVAYVGGSGTGASRVIEEVGTATGADRYELWVDGSSSDDTELASKGLVELAKYQYAETISANVIALDVDNNEVDPPFKLYDDFDVGDIVTVVIDKFNIQRDIRIEKVVEIYSNQGNQIQLNFGSPLIDSTQRLANALSNKFLSFENTITK